MNTIINGNVATIRHKVIKKNVAKAFFSGLPFELGEVLFPTRKLPGAKTAILRACGLAMKNIRTYIVNIMTTGIRMNPIRKTFPAMSDLPLLVVESDMQVCSNVENLTSRLGKNPPTLTENIAADIHTKITASRALDVVEILGCSNGRVIAIYRSVRAAMTLYSIE